jgi:hypothetical protein
MKKFISLFLVFSLMMISTNLYAKERRGAELLITKKNGGKIEGELIAVKENSLLVLTKWTGRDVSVDIADVEVITIVKKSKLLLGGSLGVLVCGGAGALIGYEIAQPRGFALVDYSTLGIILGGVIGLLVGGLIGGFIGSSLGKDKKIQFEGMTDLKIRETLEKLRKKARIRDYK